MSKHLKRLMLPVLLAGGAGLSVRLFAADPVDEHPLPNIIIIFADDLGYADLSCYGHPSIRTPEIDQMAAEGMRFTDFYAAAPVCTPSRAGLLTGRLPIRSGMAGTRTNRVLYPDSTGGLPTSEITIAGALKEAGYRTACVGKWHLGHLPEFLPTAHGFDEFLGLPYSNDMDVQVRRPGLANKHPEPQNDWWNPPLMEGTDIIERPAIQETLTRRYTERSIEFIKKNTSQPFFLYLAHTFPHVPLFASEPFRGQSPRGSYGDTVEEIDWSTGRILDTLRELGIERSTLVIFTSDNGPWLIKDLAGGSAGMLKDGKGSTWEGGMRVPAIAWWPGSIPAGSTVHQWASILDWFPTALALANQPLPPDRIIDGADIGSLLRDPTVALPERPLFYYRSDQLQAVRMGDFKAHFITYTGYSKEPEVIHDSPLLFHLGHDPSENFNVADKHPEIVAKIMQVTDEHKAALVPGKNRIDRPKSN